jgi:hypothetical protein
VGVESVERSQGVGPSRIRIRGSARSDAHGWPNVLCNPLIARRGRSRMPGKQRPRLPIARESGDGRGGRSPLPLLQCNLRVVPCGAWATI